MSIPRRTLAASSPVWDLCCELRPEWHPNQGRSVIELAGLESSPVGEREYTSNSEAITQ